MSREMGRRRTRPFVEGLVKDTTRVLKAIEAQERDEGGPRASALPSNIDKIGGRTLAAATSARQHLTARRQHSRDLVDRFLTGNHLTRWVLLGSTRALADSETLAELLRRSGDRTLRVADREDLLLCYQSASLQLGGVQRSPRLSSDPQLTAVLGLAEIALESGELSRLETMLEAGRTSAPIANGDLRLLARSTLLRALVHWHRHQFRSALSLLARVGHLGQELADLDLEAQALLLSQRIQRNLGNFEAFRVAQAHLQRRIPRAVIARVTEQIEQILGSSARVVSLARLGPEASSG